MKKSNLLKLISMILICVMLMGAIAVTAFATTEQESVSSGENTTLPDANEDNVVSDEETVEICKKNIIFGEKIQLMFAVKAPENVTVTAVCGEQEIGIEYLGNQTIEGVEYRVYQTTEGWAAQNINAVVTVTATAGEQTDVLSYSVLMYLYERLNLDDLDPVVDADRIAMYEALLAYAKAADKVVNNENGRTPNDLDSYHYVAVVNGTLDGYNEWGMFKEGDTPFANVTHTLSQNKTIEWTYSVNGVDFGLIELEELKALAVEGTVIVTAAEAADHMHDGDYDVYLPITNAEELKAAFEVGGNYFIKNDIALTEGLTVSADVTLCLNGKILKNDGSVTSALITLDDGVSLNITDCTETERAGYIDPTTNLWTQGTYSGEESVVEVTLKGGIIMGANGSYGGAIMAKDDTPDDTKIHLSIENVNFVNNTSSAQAGAIYGNSVLIALDNVSFVANSSVLGGAMHFSKGELTTKNCQFIGNISEDNGGAIYLTNDTTVYVDGTEDGNNGSIFSYNVGQNGGALLAAGETTLYNTTFDHNTATAGGGAVYVNTGICNAYGVSFTNNASTTGQAGALYVNTTVNTYACTFNGNATGSGKNGGAVYVTGAGYYTDGVADDATQASTFENNTAANYGGAIGSNGSVNLYYSTFRSNTALYGGAVYVAQDDGKNHTVTIDHCTFERNEATGTSSTIGGGALAATKTIPVTIIGGSFTENVSAYYGGAISVAGTSSITISGGTTITANVGKTGSALYFKTKGQVTVSDITLEDNLNGTNGVIYVGDGTADLRHTFTGVTASGNSANKGGVFYISGGYVTITDSTLTGNAASGNDGWGGAIYISATNRLIVNNSTISGNEAKLGGGIYATGASIAYELNETQVTGNTATTEDGGNDIYPVVAAE